MESATKIHEGASTTPELDTEQVPLTLNSLKAKSRGSKIYKASASISPKKEKLSTQEASTKNFSLTPAVLLPQGYNTIKELQHVYREKKKVKVSKTYEMAYGRDITALTMTPDSGYIISGSQDGTINVFRTITNQLYKSIGRVHEGKINAFAFGPLTDCTTSLITASDDRSIKIFDWQHELDSFHLQNAHEGRVTCVIYNHAKQCIISGSSDNFINIFAMTTNPLYANLSHRIYCYYNGPIASLALKHDGMTIFSSGDTSIKVHNLDSYKEIYHFKDAHSEIISSIILSPDKYSLISASHDMSIKVWDIHEYKSSPVHHLENVHTEKIKSIDISSDSNFILSTGEKGSIKVSSIKEKLQVHQIPKNPQNKLAMFNKTGETSSIIVGATGHIDFLNFETMQAPFFKKDLPLQINDDFESENILSANHQHILSFSSQKKSTKLFDSNTLQLLDDMSYHFEIPYDSKVLVSSNGRYVVTIDSNNRLNRFDRVKEVATHVDISDAVNSAIISPDSQVIICACDNSIQTFNIETLTSLSSIEYKHSVPIEFMTMSSDLKYLVASRVDRSILLFNFAERRELYHFKDAHQRKINGIAINKNLIASCSQDKSIKLFDTETYQLVHHFINPDNREIHSVGLSLDNRFIFAGSENLRVFDLETKMTLLSFNKITGNSLLPSFSNLTSSPAFTSSQIKAIATLPNGNILCLHKHGPPEVYQFKEDFQKIPSHTFNNLDTPQPSSSNEQEISYFYFKSHYSLFNSLEDSIFSNNLQKEKAYAKALESEFYIFPHSWNLLHIACIEENHAFIKNMPAYKDFKLQFILDHHLETPLHYLLAHQEIDNSSVNIILAYICDYLEAHSHNKYEYSQIIKSLTPLLWFIFQKSQAQIKERFLHLCEINSPIAFNLELPACGSPSMNSAHFMPTPEISQKLTEKICRKGQEEVHFKTNLLYLDYNVASEDMNMVMTSLTKDFTTTSAVTGLVDHLWRQSKLFLAMNLAIFSVFIVGLSVYIGLQRSHVPFEAALIAYSGLLLCGELLKFSSLKSQYLSSPWRLVGFLHLILTIIFLAVRLAQKDKSNIALSWVSAIIILVGYLMWITHLRLIKPIRKLFTIILRIARDMMSFVAIAALIIIAFAIVFLVFKIGGWDHSYGFYLYNAYTNLYGTFESSIDSSDTVSQKLIIVTIAFILNVLFLHLLIPFMSESYQKVLKEKVKIESLTKLEMIQNVCGLIRFCQKLKGKSVSKRGYLVFCLPKRQSSPKEIHGQGETANLMKELFNKNEQNNKKRFADLGENLGGNMESLQESIKGLQLAEYEYQRVRDQVEVIKQKNSCLEEFHAKVRELIDFEVIKGKNLVIKALDDVIMNCKNQEANVVRAGDFD